MRRRGSYFMRCMVDGQVWAAVRYEQQLISALSDVSNEFTIGLLDHVLASVDEERLTSA
jgi:hypothetical protein